VSGFPARPKGRSGPDGGVPTVFVSDEQQAAPVDASRWSGLAEQVLAELGVQGEAELSVIFVDERHITQLNERFMGHDGATDVLSFPIDGLPEPSTSGLTPAARSGFDPDDEPLLLGDVVICPAVAARQAAEHAGTYDDEMALLLVHGVLHLLGLDHADDDERRAMQARERELLERFHGPLAGDPWTGAP
jgi:probable rRNA maturation factor